MVDVTRPMLHTDPLMMGEAKDEMVQSMRVACPDPLPAQGVATYVAYLQGKFVENLFVAGFNEIDIENIDVRLIPKTDDHGQPDARGFSVTFVTRASKAVVVIQ